MKDLHTYTQVRLERNLAREQMGMDKASSRNDKYYYDFCFGRASQFRAELNRRGHSSLTVRDENGHYLQLPIVPIV